MNTIEATDMMRSTRRFLTLAALATTLALLPACGDNATYTAPTPIKGKIMTIDEEKLAARQKRLEAVKAELDRRINYTIAGARQKLREEADVVRRDLSQAEAGDDTKLKNELREVARLLVSLDLQQEEADGAHNAVTAQANAITVLKAGEITPESYDTAMNATDAALKAADALLAQKVNARTGADAVTEEAIDRKVVEMTRSPLPAVTLAEARKRREEWRAAKNAKAVANDPAGTVYTDPNTGNPTLDPEKATADKIERPDDWVDPDNPNLKPADRTLAEKFDITKAPVIEGAVHVPFATLSGYTYASMLGVQEEPDAKNEKKDPDRVIPDPIKALDGKLIVVEGYMMPIDFEDGGTNEFILTRVIPSCFYCQPPQLNDWIEVKMEAGKRIDYVPDAPIRVFGKIKVGEVFEDGFIVCLYQMSGTKADKAPTP